MIVPDCVLSWAAWTTRICSGLCLLSDTPAYSTSCWRRVGAQLSAGRGQVFSDGASGVSAEQRLRFQDVRGLILLGISSSHSVLDASASPYSLGDQTAPISCCAGLRVRELFPTTEQLCLAAPPGGRAGPGLSL